MRKKFRIFSTLTAMVLVVIVMCVGIWAATQVELTGSGQLNVSVSSSEVLATVTVNFNNEGTFSNGGQNEQKFTFKGDASYGEHLTQGISLPNYTFVPDDKDVSFTVQIKNDNALKGLSSTLEVTNDNSGTPFEISITNSGSPESPVSDPTTINAGELYTYTVTITYTGDFGADASAQYSFSLTLKNVEE